MITIKGLNIEKDSIMETKNIECLERQMVISDSYKSSKKLWVGVASSNKVIQVQVGG